MATETQRLHALTTYFIKVFKEHYDRAPIVNRNTAKWGWQNILMDNDDEHARELVDFYFTTKNPKGHSLDWLLRNYSDYQEAMENAKIDAERRKKMREESEVRAREWRQRLDNNRTTGP